jgi:predicted secreted protein
MRWRVSQSITLEGADFPVLATLVTRLQNEDGLLISGIGFSVAPSTQRAAEDRLMQQAVHTWQQRAQAAAEAFGGTSWRAGRITIQGNEGGRPQPMMRVQAMAAGSAPPVNVEAGTTEVSVTVSGEVILESVRAPAR